MRFIAECYGAGRWLCLCKKAVVPAAAVAEAMAVVIEGEAGYEEEIDLICVDGVLFDWLRDLHGTCRELVFAVVEVKAIGFLFGIPCREAYFMTV